MIDDNEPKPQPALSKNAIKKLKRLEYIKLHRKEVRERKKAEKRSQVKELDDNPDRISKRDRIRQEKEHLKLSQSSFPRVVIDCSYENLMSKKEINKTRMQILRCYNLLKNPAMNSFHLHLGNFQESSILNLLFKEKTPNFNAMHITRFSSQVFNEFDKKDLVYLTPDSSNLLNSVESDKVYIIGGFVDDNIKRNTSFEICERHNVATACLPIAKHFVNVNHKQLVLTINQVFEIMILVYNGVSWQDAFKKVLPQRKGYVSVKNDYKNVDL